FFWVARMIMAGYEYRKELPFKYVYYTGIVRDSKRRKMSKSLGNSPDPIELMQKYGADGVRVGMLLSSPAGNDLLFDEKLCEQGRNFTNKIWNAFRLISLWEVDESLEQPPVNQYAIDWIKSRIGQEIDQINDHFEKFRLSDALMSIYKLIWDDYCSWMLETIKPEYEKPVDSKTKSEVLMVLDELLKIAHPFIPFITEEIWQTMEKRADSESLMIMQQPSGRPYDQQILDSFAFAQEATTNVRSIRKQKNIPNKDALSLQVSKGIESQEIDLIKKLCNVGSLEISSQKEGLSASFIVKGTEFNVPLSADAMDMEAEVEKLQKELQHTKGFLSGVMKKLNNERFVQNAPEQVINLEKKKKADAEEKIKILEEQLHSMS
ncbi:MAG: class I tRNA ligase family protein, partial [Flavobacteriales bacterium]|nr:class I tRNA ligase family protein [Flavobacteriales bacterium]